MTKVAPTTLADLLQQLPGGPTSNGASLVHKAYQFAREAHAGRRRETGESYIEHDLAVGHIICKLGFDTNTITASILHDVLQAQSSITEAAIRRQFGPEVASLVAALDKLAPYAEGLDQRKDDKTLETIRRAILSTIEGDTRVIVIYLADRLQELRKAGDLPLDTRLHLASEARDIDAPLANRLGIWQLKWELEDLAFRYLEPDQYRRIASQIDERRGDRAKRIDAAIRVLSRRIREANVRAEVTGRPKHIYSIYRKMRDKRLNFEDIYDIRALRVIIEEDQPNLCYQVLGIVHNLWQPIPQEFDDYIARAKANGYQSLHTAVIDERGQTLEVQIRTRAMHDEAERGIAAHWAYKEGGRGSAALNQHINFLRQLMESVRDSDGIPVNADIFKAELLGERIYVFTPRGDVIDLPAGSTPIDFAYSIHTEVGHRCRGARVNGKMVSLDYKLKSGDKVDIITANKGGPSRDWMNESLGYTGSARSRSKIRAWFRQQERDKNIAQGREVVTRELKRLGVSDEFSLQDIAEALRFKDVDQFLAKVGFGDIQTSQIGGAIAAVQQKLRPDDELRQLLKGGKPSAGKLTVRGLSGMHTKMARCCNPIPPEPIIGYVTRGRGVTIHRQDCRQLFATKEPERWIEVEWGVEEEAYPIPIVIRAYRRPGLMDDIANILKGANINLARTKATTADSIATVYLVAEVTSLDQLNWLLGKLEKISNVIEARRQRWGD
jgi:RelA/SpoT family (p)ppGpp synthetase